MDSMRDPRTQMLLTNLLTPWAIGVASNAPAKWILPVNVAPVCALEIHGGMCGQFAVGGCHVCGRPICLAHALVGGDATIVCWACVRAAKQVAKTWVPPQPAASPPAPGAHESLDWAYELLGVKPEDSLAAIKKAYKARIAHYHPDRAETAEQKEQDGALVRMLNRAYDQVLKARKGASP